MHPLALKAWFCALLLFSAGVAGAWQNPPPGEPMPCDQMAAQMTQGADHGHPMPVSEHQDQEAPASECASPGLCCLGSCMAPIALQSKALHDNARSHTTPASVQEALTQTSNDPHFRPPIALS